MTEGASALTDCYSAGEVRNAHTYASSGTSGLIGYGNDYRAENCFSYGAVSAAAGTAGGLRPEYRPLAGTLRGCTAEARTSDICDLQEFERAR